MDTSLLDMAIKVVSEYDKSWIQRKRTLNSVHVFKTLISIVVTNIGVSSCVIALKCTFSNTALSKVRIKLNNNCFKNINAEISKSFNDNIFAIDGSKIRVHNGFKKLGYTPPTNK